MKSTLSILVVLLLLACTKAKMDIHMTTENADNLTTESIVVIRGFQVGKVNRIRLDENGSIGLEVAITEEIKIPDDSQFTIVKTDLFGPHQISIEPGISNGMLQDGDTIRLVAGSNNRPDSLGVEILNIFKNLTGSEQRDSILQELRRLNENLENLQTNN